MKIFLFVLILFFLCLTGTNFAQEKPDSKLYEFKGVVKTADGSVFAGVPLYFKSADKSDFVSTDINGEFSIELAPGNYEVSVRRTISETFKAFIFIQENGLNPQNVEFTVEPNAVCCGDSTEKPYPKITRLARPPYPAAARAVRVFGEVVVEIKIDKEGKITEAKAVSGHPLLRVASVQAAKSSLFETSASDEIREVKLTFVFLPDNREKKNLKRYSNLYRVEIVSDVVEIIDPGEVR